ncbi:hypothetical protein ATK74_0628 [Propionicimonas paludicola]|uniref:Lipoprotein n=1 Tax=Propionicimonas paludicola TaxID=185243 RepID=A0A2A9CNR2_9ACTN|nr:hypothetical protein [Propionicimonas paludicola]PFG16097.1 hypothetical protein ATK74_0628 [Propionicimonas paludicola]
MTRARRIRLAFAAVVITPLLAACTFTGDIAVTEQGTFTVNLLVKDSSDVCSQDFTQSVLEGLTIEKLDDVGSCRVTGTAGAGLAAVLGVTVTHDESGYRLSTSQGMSWWNPNTVDLKVRFPGPITEVEGAEQVGPDEVRVAYNGYEDIPAITIASRSGFGPSKVEWAAGAGLLTGVGLTLLVIWLIRLRRRRLQVAIDWPAPEGFPAGTDAESSPRPDDAAFWSGRDEPAPPVVGERRRSVVDPSTWAPPPG